MIFEFKIPDEVYEKYGSQQAVWKRVVDTADMPNDTDWVLQFTKQELADLRRHFGLFKTATHLFQRIMAVGSIKLQGVELQMSGDQTAMLKERAYFNAEVGEPTSAQEAEGYPKEVVVEQIQRYVREQLAYAVNVVLDLV
ncbi:hypothetical protein KAR91_45055 [Candidatus Pacearchaeota archaeon]|nr:hypothetical protein [Candidatus Pacearchaeota archaeon]